MKQSQSIKKNVKSYKRKYKNYNSYSGIQYKLLEDNIDSEQAYNLKYTKNVLKKTKEKFKKDLLILKDKTTLKQMIKYSAIYSDLQTIT